jgi:hypothetical protein
LYALASNERRSCSVRTERDMLGHLFQCDPDIRIARSEIYPDPAEPR